MVTGTRSWHRSPRDELDRFEAVLDVHRTGAGEEFAQVTDESKARHLRPVADGIAGAPTGLHGVQVGCHKSGSDERMATVDTGVEQTRMGRVVGLRRESGSSQEVVEPLGLFVTFQRIEEVRGLFRASQLGNTVERDHGAFHLLHGSAGHHHSAFREDQLSLCHLHALGSGPLAERSSGCVPVSAHGQPDLPPDCAVVGRGECVGFVGPERSQTRRPDLSDSINQAPVIAGTAGPVARSLQIFANQAFEVIELAIGDEDSREGPIVLLTDIEEFDSRPLSGQALEGQLDVGEALELHLQAQTVLHSGGLLRFPGIFSHTSELADLVLQRRAVLWSILRRNLRTFTATRSRISIRFGFGDAIKDEMPA